jgi:ATP-dependent RNA helicase DOB1
MDEDQYVDTFNGALMHVVHAWCNGTSFVEITKMTDMFEGARVAISKL